MVQGAPPLGWHADRAGQEAGPLAVPAVSSLPRVTHTTARADGTVTGTAGGCTAQAVTSLTAGSVADDAAGVSAGLSAASVAAIRDLLTGSSVPRSQAERVEVLRGLEDLKATITAVQARVALDLDETTRADETRAGVRPERVGKAVPQEVGPALRRSPFAARAFLGAARIWATEMPHTFTALTNGWLTEQRAMLLVRETACLPLNARQEVDARLCGEEATLDGVSTAELLARVRQLAAQLDPAAVVARARRAEGERYVSLRPAPDTMTYLTALLPAAQGVAVYGALKTAATTAAAATMTFTGTEGGTGSGARTGEGAGDTRSVGQRMADLLVTRVTGQATADAVPVTVNLVISDETLLGAGHEPAVLLDGAGHGHGPVPAQIARQVTAAGLDADAAWLRTLYADPAGNLIAATSRQRFFADGLTTLLRVRDQGICRTPYCAAPARHLDHITPHATGGTTTLDNGQGLCEACNQAKEHPGWRHEPGRDPDTGRHQVRITTPTGHEYLSTAPPPPTPIRRATASAHGPTVTTTPAPQRPPSGDTPLERTFATLVDLYHAA